MSFPVSRHAWIAAAALCAGALLGGCVVQDTKPQPKLQATVATAEIPEAQLLDVGIRILGTGIPKELENNAAELEKKRLYPDVRKTEARFLANGLRDTLAGSGQWGAVRVIPDSVQFVDVLVSGDIVESNGARLKLDIAVHDSAGRKWLAKRYEGEADISSYHDAASTRARDPFANLFVNIANDILAAREKLAATDRVAIRQITELKFAQDLAPDKFNGYLQTDKKGITHIQRLPAADDPMLLRVRKIRERDSSLIDTVSDQYAGFSEQVGDAYNGWRRDSYTEVLAEEKLKNQARTRTILGAAAVLGSIFAPGVCGSDNYSCRRAESIGRTAAAVGGVYAVLSGLKKSAEAKNHTASLKELSASLDADVKGQVVEVEGRTLKLTGTAEQQYVEWRKTLHEIYGEETGVAAGVPATAPQSSPAPAAVAPTPEAAPASGPGAGAAAASSAPAAPALPASGPS
ncbi:MAG: hypothetical protein JSS24_01065 [Proteobacteria bacterium]|nr:hypothetical protein [Pseudomonadota bacterium]